MQTIYVATIRAAHDFNTVMARQAFASRVVAHRWAHGKAVELLDNANHGEEWDGYDFRTDVTALAFDDTPSPLVG